MKLVGLDHLVLTVRSVEVAADFYARVLGMRRETFGEGRTALHFGAQKINLLPAHDAPVGLVAARPGPGTADLCFVVDSVESARDALAAAGVEVIVGPVARAGAMGEVQSVYCRDPDGNLIELSEYPPGGGG